MWTYGWLARRVPPDGPPTPSAGTTEGVAKQGGRPPVPTPPAEVPTVSSTGHAAAHDLRPDPAAEVPKDPIPDHAQ